MTAKNLAACLSAAGIAVLSHSERDDAADAGVFLSGNRDVQIAGRRLILNQWVEEDEASWELGEFRSVAELIGHLKGSNR